MVSKCANPACSEKFLRLHQGKLFRLGPTPEVELAGEFAPSLYERFWLCDKCSKRMTLVWAETEAKLVPLPEERTSTVPVDLEDGEENRKSNRAIAARRH